MSSNEEALKKRKDDWFDRKVKPKYISHGKIEELLGISMVLIHRHTNELKTPPGSKSAAVIYEKT